jgi:hypothetical protein
VPPLEASRSHHAGCDFSGWLIVPAQIPLTHKIQLSQETDTVARRDSNLLPQPASDLRLTQHCLGDVFVLGRGTEIEQTCTGLVRDLYHHTRHYCSTIVSHATNCCGRYKWIWMVSCNPSKISHLPCSKLAQVVALSSPAFIVKLSGWLLYSCNGSSADSHNTTERSGLPSTHQTVPDIVLLSSEQTGFVGRTAADAVGLNEQDTGWCCVNPACWISKTVGLSYWGVIENLQPPSLFPSYWSAKHTLIMVIQSATV